VLDSTYPAVEVVLLDSGSEDGSVAYVEREFPGVEVVALRRNLGFAGGYDRIIRQDRPELLVLLNNDTAVKTDWLEPLVEVMDTDEHVAIAGCQMLRFSDHEMIDHAGGKINPLGGGIDLRKGWRLSNQRNQKVTVSGFACGGGMMLRRTAYLHVGGFDTDYIAYHEDVDLAWRCWLMGWKVAYVPQSVVYHHGSAHTGPMETPHRLFLCQKNRVRNLIKNAGRARLWKGLVAAAGFDLVRLIRFIRCSGFDQASTLLLANLEVLREVPFLMKKRRSIQQFRRRSDDELQRLGVFVSLREAILEYFFLIGG
jgi:GT2 family glycosyltransferase